MGQKWTFGCKHDLVRADFFNEWFGVQADIFTDFKPNQNILKDDCLLFEGIGWYNVLLLLQSVQPMKSCLTLYFHLKGLTQREAPSTQSSF